MDVVQVGVSRHRRQNITRSRRPRHGPKSLDLPGVRGRRSNSTSGTRGGQPSCPTVSQGGSGMATEDLVTTVIANWAPMLTGM